MPATRAARLFLIFASVCVVWNSPAVAGSPADSDDLLVGVKIYESEGRMEETVSRWRDLGINTAFISQELLEDSDFRNLAAEHQIDTFLIAPIFFNPEALQNDPDLYAIKADGERAKDDWVEFVCPSRPDYRARRAQEIAALIRQYRPHGISLDFIRHFVFWEMLRPETDASELPNTCFCPHCLTGFSRRSGLEIPDTLSETQAKADWILTHHPARWTEWKIHLITTMAETVVTEARRVDPEIQVNLHAVPWRGSDYQGAIHTIAGQDFAALSQLTDYVSPMCYSFMLRRDPDWVHSVVQDLSTSATVGVVPSIQVKEAYRLEERLSNQEFENTLRQALKPPSRGVVLWSWAALTQDPVKQETIRRVLLEREQH